MLISLTLLIFLLVLILKELLVDKIIAYYGAKRDSFMVGAMEVKENWVWV